MALASDFFPLHQTLNRSFGTVFKLIDQINTSTQVPSKLLLNIKIKTTSIMRFAANAEHCTDEGQEVRSSFGELLCVGLGRSLGWGLCT